MIKVFDFLCTHCNRVEEKFTVDDVVSHCSLCGKEETKLITSMNFKLDGTDPSYTTEWDRWAKVHEKEAKRNS